MLMSGTLVLFADTAFTELVAFLQNFAGGGTGDVAMEAVVASPTRMQGDCWPHSEI